MTDFARARKAMVDNQLRTSSITDRRLLTAMGEVPRERFVPETRRDLAYIDEAHRFPGPSGRSLPPPAPFARLVQLCEVGPEDTVLDVGAGNGYSSAVLARLGAKVAALESDAGLATQARENLAAVGAGSVIVVEGPLEAGAPKLAEKFASLDANGDGKLSVEEWSAHSKTGDKSMESDEATTPPTDK